MKKLLILGLVSSIVMAESNFVTGTKNVAGKVAEVVEVPFVAVKEMLTDNEVIEQLKNFPGERIESAQETYHAIADSKFVAKVKEVNQKVVDTTKNAATTVANAAVKAKDATVSAVVKAKDATVKTAKEIAKSEAVEDAKDVGQQFANAPFEIAEDVAANTKALWARVVAATKAAKKELFA